MFIEKLGLGFIWYVNDFVEIIRIYVILCAHRYELIWDFACK